MDLRDIREASRQLAILADRHAAEGEAAGRLHPAVLGELSSGPLLRAMLATDRGGAALPAAGLAEVVAQVSRGCGSAGLCVAWYVGRVWMAAQFSAGALDAVEAGPSLLVTDALAPKGVLVPDGDHAWVLSGEWPYATGVADAQWLIATAESHGQDGRVALVSCLVPRAAFEIVPRWTAMGMRATGTDGVRVAGWRITADYLTPFGTLLDGRPGDGGSVVHYPFDALSFLAMSACALGMAERVYDEARQLLMQGADLERNPARMGDLGNYFARLRVAQAAVQKMGMDLHRMAGGGEAVSLAVRQGMRVTAAEIIEQCVHGAVSVAAQCGTRSMLADSPVQRFVRDLIVLSSHIFVRSDLARAGFREQLLARN